MKGLASSRPHSLAAGAVLVAALLGAVGVYRVQVAAAPSAPQRRLAVVSVGDVKVTVGGVGRVVAAGSSTIGVPAGSTAGAAAGPAAQAGSTPAPVGAVFARVSATVSHVLVTTGDHVVAGQRVALLDDAGAAATTAQQAHDEAATAAIELARARRPLTPTDVRGLRLEIRRAKADLETLRGGTVADRARALAVAQRAARAAALRLRALLSPRRSADEAAAVSDVARARADLAALTTVTPGPTSTAVAAAQAALAAARARLAKVSGPPDPLALSAARAEVTKAQADLVLLLAASPPASGADVAAAQAALEAATARLAVLLAPADPAEVAAAEAEVRKAESELATLQAPPAPVPAAALAAAEQAVTAAETTLAVLRLPPLPADVAAARLEVVRARADVQTLRQGSRPAALAAARAALVSARSRLAFPSNPRDVDLARVRVVAAAARQGAAGQTAELLTVRAVTAGTVTGVLTRRGAPVDPTTPIVAVSDLARLAADVDVSEFDAALVRAGMPALLKVDALGGRAYPGSVVSVAPTGSDSAGVVTYPVRVVLPAVEGLRPGMNVSVRIVVEERRAVLRVPLEAVSGGAGAARHVRVLQPNGRVTRRAVTVGLADNAWVQVVDGLRKGDRVVLPAGAP